MPAKLPLAKRIELKIARVLFALPPRAQLWLSGRPALVRAGATLHPQLQLALTLNRGHDKVIALSHPSLSKARRNMVRDTTRFLAAAPEVHAVRDFRIATPDAELPARHYTPAPSAEQRPLLVFLHGGGFALGNLDSHDDLCRRLCSAGRLHVLSVEYRKAPEAPFPAATVDALAALRYAQAHARALGADESRIAVGGDSAGANLATFVARRTRHDRPPFAQVLIYPATDFSTQWPSREQFGRGLFLTAADITWFDEQYAAGAQAKADPDLSPLCDPDLRGLCPAVVMTAELDPLRDEGEAYAAALASAGNRVVSWREVGLTHGFVHLAVLASAAEQAVDRLVARVSSLLHEPVVRPVSTARAEVN